MGVIIVITFTVYTFSFSEKFFRSLYAPRLPLATATDRQTVGWTRLVTTSVQTFSHQLRKSTSTAHMCHTLIVAITSSITSYVTMRQTVTDCLHSSQRLAVQLCIARAKCNKFTTVQKLDSNPVNVRQSSRCWSRNVLGVLFSLNSFTEIG